MCLMPMVARFNCVQRETYPYYSDESWMVWPLYRRSCGWGGRLLAGAGGQVGTPHGARRAAGLHETLALHLLGRCASLLYHCCTLSDAQIPASATCSILHLHEELLFDAKEYKNTYSTRRVLQRHSSITVLSTRALCCVVDSVLVNWVISDITKPFPRTMLPEFRKCCLGIFEGETRTVGLVFCVQITWSANTPGFSSSGHILSLRLPPLLYSITATILVHSVLVYILNGQYESSRKSLHTNRL